MWRDRESEASSQNHNQGNNGKELHTKFDIQFFSFHMEKGE